MSTMRDGWRLHDSAGDARVAFFGKGLPRQPGPELAARLPRGLEIAWAEQIHSAEVLTLGAAPGDGKAELRPGCVGRGDALITGRPELALMVVTADCVPVLLAGNGAVAAVHAGWRGLVDGVIPAALGQLGETPDTAWIGPAIGLAAYEVGPEVAEKVVAASDPSVRRDPPGQRPHVDLQLTAEIQLRHAGIAEIRRVDLCTFSAEEELWSYRRDGAGAGRNVSLIWRSLGDGNIPKAGTDRSRAFRS